MRQRFARRSILGFGLGGAGAALLGLTSRGETAPASYKADLSAASEVPPNQSTGKGAATVTYDDSTRLSLGKAPLRGYRVQPPQRISTARLRRAKTPV